MKTIIFDLDNTLIECGKYYKQAMQAVVLHLVTATQLPEDLVFEMVEHVDLAGTVLQDGWQRWRFPRACAAASYALDGLQGQQPDVRRAAHVQAIAERVFDAPYEMYDGVEELLTKLRREEWQLAILTKGDTDVQLRKLHQLIPYVDSVKIVPKKSADVLKRYIEELHATMRDTWVVGDSMKDDIYPAHHLGLQAAWVCNPSSHWGYEDAEPYGYTLRVDAVTELGRNFRFIPFRRKQQPVQA